MALFTFSPVKDLTGTRSKAIVDGSTASSASKTPIPSREGGIMTAKKTLQQRTKELQLRLTDPAGRKELQELASRYHVASGKLKPLKTSVITYILVHERERGLIGG
jgi:hypothetical protein